MSKYTRINARNTGNLHAVASRVYGVGGKRYPRISVSLYWSNCELVVTCSEKLRSNCWWENYSLPVSLIGEASEMVAEYGGVS